MAVSLRIKKSTTAGNVPASLDIGEIAVNEADELLFYRDSAGEVQAHDLAPRFYIPISGRIYLQTNEYNGFSALGPYVQNHNNDLGNANAAFNPNRNATGFSFPHNMTVERLYGDFRNNNVGAPAWSFVVWKQLKTEDSTVVTNTVLWQDSDDFRNYADNLPHKIDQTIDQPLAAGEMLSLAVRAAINNNTEYVYPLSLSFVLKRDFS